MRCSRCGSSVKKSWTRWIADGIRVELYVWSLVIVVAIFALSAGFWGAVTAIAGALALTWGLVREGVFSDYCDECRRAEAESNASAE